MFIGRSRPTDVQEIVRLPEPELTKKEPEDSKQFFKSLPGLNYPSKMASLGQAILKITLAYIGKNGEAAPTGQEPSLNTQSLTSRAKAMFLGSERKLAASILGVGGLAAAGLAAYSLKPSMDQSLQETGPFSHLL